MTVTAYVGLGSNLGDRQSNLDRAIQALQDHASVEVTQISSYYETEPVGGPPGQPDFLNAVVELQTDLDPEEHYTDTHGYTELNFAAFPMFGKRFADSRGGAAFLTS